MCIMWIERQGQRDREVETGGQLQKVPPSGVARKRFPKTCVPMSAYDMISRVSRKRFPIFVCGVCVCL